VTTNYEAVLSRRDPWPGSLLYNAVSSNAIFRQHYELVANDIANYGTVDCILDIGPGLGHLPLAMQKLLSIIKENCYLINEPDIKGQSG